MELILHVCIFFQIALISEARAMIAPFCKNRTLELFESSCLLVKLPTTKGQNSCRFKNLNQKYSSNSGCFLNKLFSGNNVMFLTVFYVLN